MACLLELTSWHRNGLENHPEPVIVGEEAILPSLASGIHMIDPSNPVDFLVRGITSAGRPFRPSDWADRLAGIMSQFRPAGTRPASALEYSPWVQPTLQNGDRCVMVKGALALHEPMAYAFLLNFARDNDLRVEVNPQTL